MASHEVNKSSGSIGVRTETFGSQVQTPPKTGALNGKSVRQVPGSELPKEPKAPVRTRENGGLGSMTVEQQKPTPKLLRAAWTSGVATREDVIKISGEPKKKMFGFIPMSTGYKNVLSGLSDYHQGLKQADTGNPKATIETLAGQLDKIFDLADRYAAKSKHTHKGMVGEVQMQVEREKVALEGLKSELSQGAKIPEGMSFETVLAFAREGISLRDMASVKDMSPLEARNHIEYQSIGKDLSDKEKTAYTQAGFRASEAVLLHRSGLGIEGGLQYRGMDIPITPETIVTSLKHENVTGKPEMLGKGGFNTVFKVNYKTGENTTVEGIFKPLSSLDDNRAHRTERGWVAKETGVNQYNPQIALRNLATCNVAAKLGFDVVPKTVLGTAATTEGEKPTLGLVMERAAGRPAKETPRHLFENATVQREILKLQMLDHLVGQGDRHHNNYFIHVDAETGKVKVTGIDNDQCFGKNLKNPNGIAQDPYDDDNGFRGTTLPPLLDRDTANALLSMSKDDLAKCMEGMRPSEISAAQGRLQHIQEFIGRMDEAGQIVSPDKFGGAKILEKFSSEDSYLGRDVEYARYTQPKQKPVVLDPQAQRLQIIKDNFF